MSESTIVQNDLQEGVDAPEAKPKKTLDKGAKRNLIIIGSAAAVAIVAMAAIALTSGGPPVREQGLAQTNIDPGMGMGQNRSSGQLTPDELQRLDRVTTQKAERAAQQGVTFIPSEVPFTPAPQPSVAPPPPGTNYSVATGAQSGGGTGYDPERVQRMMQGFQTQLGRIAQVNSAPPTTSAPRYQVARDTQAGAQTGAVAGASAQNAQAMPAGETVLQPALVNGLHLAAGELISPIETDKTSFASAKIASGPLSGATIYGVTQMVADQGVRVKFNRMLFGGRSYSINAIALDPSVSHDTLSADIDRKLLERYVLPLVGATASAYLQAIGQAGQQVVLGPGSTPVVVQPELSAKQAAAQGVASGINQALSEYGRSRTAPSASMPVGSPIGVLFLDPVQQPVNGSAPVANWQPTQTASAAGATAAAPAGMTRPAP